MISVTLPWPPRELSPNFRTKRHWWVAKIRAQYRKACFDAAWARGIRPLMSLRLVSLVFHPPNKARRDNDNTTASFKGGRDGLAEAMGVDDVKFNDIHSRYGAPVKGGAVVAMIEEIPD